VDRLRPYIETAAAELLDAMEAGPPQADLAEVYARPLALRVICRTLGVPFEDYDRFGAWSDRFMSLTKYPPEEINQANEDMRAYFGRLIGMRREEPGDDLISALVRIHDEEGEPSEKEIVGLGALLLLAGHDTTVTVLCGGTATLLGNPDQLALLRENPDLYPDAVEEVVRLNGPGGGTSIRITRSWAARSSRKAPRSSPRSAPQAGTPRSTRSRTGASSSGRTAPRWPSGRDRTSASARAWPGPNWPSACGLFSNGSRGCGSPCRPSGCAGRTSPPSAAGKSCRSPGTDTRCPRPPSRSSTSTRH
jgi:hypothetical protein